MCDRDGRSKGTRQQPDYVNFQNNAITLAPYVRVTFNMYRLVVMGS